MKQIHSSSRLTYADYLHTATSESLLVKMFAFTLKMMAYNPRNTGTYLVRTLQTKRCRNPEALTLNFYQCLTTSLIPLFQRCFMM